jgi:methylated-DNA-[protein]-cysteine S-methyltransferase
LQDPATDPPGRSINCGKLLAEELSTTSNLLAKVNYGRFILKLMKSMTLDAATIIESPIGEIFIGLRNQSLVTVEILTVANKRLGFSPSSRESEILDEAQKQLAEFFSGERASFKLPISLSGTTFQKAVWTEIATLSKGEVLSYGDIAKRIGSPMAARAVGAAVGANPLPLIIGCHRVLGSNSKITGYSGGNGLETKRWLLGHENIRYEN